MKKTHGVDFLVIGSGAREDAIVDSLVRSQHRVAAAPGNPGMESRGAACYPTFKADKVDELVLLGHRLCPRTTVVGPEIPLSLGIVDKWPEGLAIVGPTAAAARLESSKIFARRFMTRHGIPTPAYTVCETFPEAIDAIVKLDGDCVLKADGLAAGKGVTLTDDVGQASQAAREMMLGGRFGLAGRSILVEEKLKGPECSAIFLCDGINPVPLLKARDYKRRRDGDEGPNTGGMGAICPAFEDKDLDEQSLQIAKQTLAGMTLEGNPFHGFLYIGLMLTAKRLKVIEFNVRLGDPEASVILPLIANNFGLIMSASTKPGGLYGRALYWHKDYLVCVVVVSKPYPDSPALDVPIAGIPIAEGYARVYHAGTTIKDGRLVTAGGRVLDIVGRGKSMEEAAAKAYLAAGKISFEGMDYRTDLGQ